MKILIKIMLLIVVIGFALINYRYFSFEKGFSRTSFEDKSVIEILNTVTGIKKVEYYHKTIVLGETSKESGSSNYLPGDYEYRVYITTNEDSYLLDATQDDIDAFKTLGIFSKTLNPEKITPIPFYVEIIIAILILVIPFGKKDKKNENKDNENWNYLNAIFVYFIHNDWAGNTCIKAFNSLFHWDHDSLIT